MRVIHCVEPGGPENLVVGEASTPVPGPGEVLVAVRACGVNRADLLQRQGHYPPPPGVSDVIGLEVSGTVAALGDGVDGWTPGEDCVALLAGGGYAEYVAVPVGQVMRPPAGVDLVSAAGLPEVAATVVSNFQHVHLAAGETVLIHGGSGGIGTFATQYAKAIGARVIVTAGTPAKRDLCLNLGADVALDYHEDWVVALKEATDRHGADVILDVMGAAYLESNVAALALDGRLVIIGLQGGRKGTLDVSRLLNKRGTVTATSLRFRPLAQKAAICADIASRVWPLVAAGTIKQPPQTRFTFAEAADAHRLLESGESTGKILLTLP